MRVQVEAMTVDELVSYFYHLIEEGHLSSLELYVFANQLLLAVADNNSYFDSLAHFNAFSKDYGGFASMKPSKEVHINGCT